ncbi:hypothetical protein MTR67_040123 [Solanum verrucosum]|uniref:Integrase zinc-binding domain-containing protein n=1 Tax=Solanum verrucosum TaxID=315347 RepID=A0AAF0UJU8_SOLVR|nr:hypothetical protein MTR67_040123 [Solanum verrucosum]
MAKQDHDPTMVEVKKVISKNAIEAFSQGEMLCFITKCWLCILNIGELRQQILLEAHCSWYSIHSGATKIYRDCQEIYWSNGIKKDISEFVASVLAINK